MFSGQGSQFPGMGRTLFENDRVFKEHLHALDGIARARAGISIIDALYGNGERPAEDAERVVYSHPTLFAVQYATAKSLQHAGVRADAMLGMSLGEYVVAALQGVAPVEEMLRFLFDKAELLERDCQPGFMLAVLADPDCFFKLPELSSRCDLVGVNYGEHFVVAGDEKHRRDIEKILDAAGIVTFRLPVPIGFHSRNLDPVMDAMRRNEAGMLRAKPEAGWFSCAAGAFVDEIPADFFSRVARGPICFVDAMRAVDERFRGEAVTWVDLGPSGTLANFVRRNGTPADRAVALMLPFSDEYKALSAVVEKHRKQEIASMPHQQKNAREALMFPGQGSQAKGMGEELFRRFPEMLDEANSILGYDLRALCVDDTDQQLGLTQYTQPALYAVSAMAYLSRREERGTPGYLAGHSLGEYSALFAAGAFSFGDGLRIVNERGRLMSKLRAGGMAAIIGMHEPEVRKVLDDHGHAAIDIANLNAPTQIVISGPQEDIRSAKESFERSGCQSYIVLNVSGAFHSRMMRGTQAEFSTFLEGFEFRPLRIPVVANVSARPYGDSDMRSLLVEQIASPVRWVESVEYLAAVGVESFEEVGPGRVLTGLLRRILPPGRPRSLPSQPAVDLPKSDDRAAWPMAQTATSTALSPPPPETDTVAPDAAPTVIAGSVAAATITAARITAERLGCARFRDRYGLRYAYLTGGMVHGIASVDVVAAMSRAGMMGFYGTGALQVAKIAEAIRGIRERLGSSGPFGMNLLPGKREDETVDLYIAEGVRNVEAAAYMQVTPALARYKLAGMRRDAAGKIHCANRILAKVSRPEVARAFLSPIPEKFLQKFMEQGLIDTDLAEAARRLPVADDLCVEADSGGHTDMGNLSTLLPAMQKIRSELDVAHVGIGAAGGIGTPEAVASAFVLGADFVLTGSINQCSVEAATSDLAKDMLQDIEVQDTDYAPAGDMFEMGAKVQVLKRGVFFPARGNKLYELYKQYDAIADLPADLRHRIEDKYFGRSFEQIYEDCRRYYSAAEIERAEGNPKQKMAYVFRWYFGHSMRAALAGEGAERVNFQIQCGPALGAFNQWVRGTSMESWRGRHVDRTALRLIEDAADWLNRRFAILSGSSV